MTCSQSPVKVFIVDDSAVFRQYLQHILSGEEGISVVGTAASGEEALKSVRQADPDVITMDVRMPGIDGYETTRRLLETVPIPIPIIIVSAYSNRTDGGKTFAAMDAGAVAVLEKPRGPSNPDSKRIIRELVRTIRVTSTASMARHQRYDPGTHTPTRPKPPSNRTASIRVVAIGASTGGPPAIKALLSLLPKPFAVPVLIVQHIAEGFLPGMVEWLASTTGLSVRVAQHCQRILPGEVYFAPNGYQMGINRYSEIVLTEDTSTRGYRPSVAHLFHSVADALGDRAVGVMLTGMGRDGANELRLMRDKGAVTIAQDAESSVVHGMPGEAIKLQAVDFVLSPAAIATKLEELTRAA